MTDQKIKGNLVRAAFLATAFAGIGVAPAWADMLSDIMERGSIRVAVDLGSPPFGMTDAMMKPTGSDVESAKLIADALGVKLEMVQVTGPNRVPTLLTGQADIVMASFSVTPDRKKVIDFTDAYGIVPVIIAAHADTKIDGIEDLKSVQIGTTRGTTGDLEAAAQFPDIPLTRYDDDATLVTALVSGQLPVMVSTPMIMQAVNRRSPNNPLELKMTLKVNPYAIGLRQGEDGLKAKLNEIIAGKLADGTFNEIYKRYNGIPLPETLPPT